MLDISVIIPIYGVEAFIERSLRSLFCQSKVDGVEFILVNDCTKDRSMDIATSVISEFPTLDIKVINHEKNRGVAATRQTGLDVATGEFTIQIDSDDWCEPTMLEDLYDKAVADDADIVICDLFWNYPNREIYCSQSAVESNLYTKAEIIFGNKIFVSLWNKLIRRTLYTDNDIQFIEGCNMGEDLYAMWRLFFLTDKISYLPKAYLHYIQNPSSLMHNRDVTSDLSINRIYQNLLVFYNDNNISEVNPLFTNIVIEHKYKQLRVYRGNEQRLLAECLPEITPVIMLCKRIMFRHRIALYLASTGHLNLANLVWRLCDKLYKLK